MCLACREQQDGTAGLSHSTKTTTITLPDTVLNKLQDGDIILRQGDGPLSFHLSRSTGEIYTHCGIIYKSKTGKLNVIHTLGSDSSEKGINGVQTQSLERFVQQSADSILFICRPIFKDSVGKQIVSAASTYLKAKIPFDYKFSLLTPEKFYCSELLYYVFKDVNDGKNVFDLTLKHKTYILLFSTFFRTENFKPIFLLKEHLPTKLND